MYSGKTVCRPTNYLPQGSQSYRIWLQDGYLTLAVSIVEDFAAIMVNFETIVNSHFFFDRAGGIVKERQARLFSPQQNLWLQACANWVQQKKEEDPCSVYPQLAELDKALEGPKTAKYLSDVAAIHLQCIRMIQAARAMHDQGCTSDKIAGLVKIGRDLLEIGSLSEEFHHDLKQSLQSSVAKPLDPLSICREVLDHISAYSKPNAETDTSKKHQLAWHLRRPCWLGDLISHLITGDWSAGIHRVRVPFFLIDTIREGEGQLAELDLQALSKGSGQVFIDPRQSFILFEDGFENIFDQTLEAAKCLIDEEDIKRDIRITINFLHVDEGKSRCSYEELHRVLASPTGHSIVLAGRSATAATGLGLYCAMTGKTADTRVIALAQTDRHGRLHEVGFIPRKVHAAVNSGLFDTIVVTHRQDQEKVYDVLEGSDFSVRVASTLQELVNASVIFGELPYPLARLYGDITKANDPKVRLRALVPFPVSEFRRFHVFRPLSFESDDTISNSQG